MDLTDIKTGLANLETIAKRREAVEAEQAGLPGEIKKLSAAVAGGKGKLAEQLSIARERFAGLPEDLQALSQERQAVVNELAAQVADLYPKLCNLYLSERQRIAREIDAFLKKCGCNQFYAERAAGDAVVETDRVKRLDMMRTIFHNLNTGRRSESMVLSYCKYALENLADL